MRINFRQGLVSSKVSSLGQPDYLTTNPQGVTVNGAETPLVFTICDGPKNYTISINASLVAWPVRLFDGVSEAWLYVEVNRATAAISYGITTVQPTYGPVAPTAPVDGAMWFNTTKLENFVFNVAVGRWLPTLRVLAGHYTTTTLNEVDFGTQIGLTGSSVTSGQIVSDGFGRAITDSSGRFFTTEDVVLIAGVESHAAKLESNVLVGSAAESIPAFHVVRFNAVGDVELADYDNVGDSVIGMSVVSGTLGNPINMVISGLVHNTAWNWPGPNRTLWVNQTGQLTMTDPYDLGGRVKRRVPVGRTVDKHTIIFDQGMGGVGEKGETGAIEGIPIASDVVPGITRLSVAPDDSNQPIAVGDNDPRLTDPRVPLEHTHPATSVTVSPFGTFNGINAQQALEHLQTIKLNLSGGTVTGPIVSTVPASQDNHLVTLGQAKNEITARAVTQRRYILNDGLPTIVQAFNALSPAARTLATNTVIIVEYRDNVYMWSGGYGSPVGATDSAQFLLLGKLTTTATLTITALNAYTTYQGATKAPYLLVALAEGKSNASYTINVETGEVLPVNALPSGVDSFAVHQGLGIIAFATMQTADDDPPEYVLNVANITETGVDMISQTTEFAAGFKFVHQLGPMAISGDGAYLAVVHTGIGEDMRGATVFDAATLEPVVHLEAPAGHDAFGRIDVVALNRDGSLVALGGGVMGGAIKVLVFQRSTGAVVCQYDNANMLFNALWFAVDGAGVEHLFVAERHPYGTDDTCFYSLPTASLPALLQSNPLLTLPQQMRVYAVCGMHTDSAGDMFAFVITWDENTSENTCQLINFTTGTRSQIALADSANYPYRGIVTGSTDGSTLFSVDGSNEGPRVLITSIDPDTHTYGASVEITVPEYYTHPPFLI